MSLTPVTRPSLMVRLRDARDHEAWSEFVRLYTPLIFSHCRRHGLQEADAADVSQEVMRAAARALPAFRYDAALGKFRGWLLQTARHRLASFFDRQQRVPLPVPDDNLECRLNESPREDAESLHWEEEYRQRVFDWAVEKVRPEFKPSTWDAFWLTAVEAVSVKEVADRVEITVGAVYIARSRVIARMRELVETVTGDPVVETEC